MKVIFSPVENDMVIGFEGWDYTVPSKKEVLVEEDVAAFLEERCPFLKVSEPKRSKPPYFVAAIKKTKTPVRINSNSDPTTDMVVRSRYESNDTLGPDNLPQSGMTDKDGVEWVGEGVEIDSLT